MRKKSRGVTLLELTIALGLLSVMTIFIISFANYSKYYSRYLTTNESVKTDLDGIKYIFDLWTSSVDSSDTTIYINSSSSIKSKSSDGTYSLSFGYLDDEKAYYCSHPQIDEDDAKYVVYYKTLKTVDSISYDFFKNNNTGMTIIHITIKYTCYDSHDKTKEVYEECSFIKCIRCASVVRGDA